MSKQDLDLTWRNAEQLKGDLFEGVAALKEEPGDTHIAISGSPSIVRQLLDAGLLDELHLLVHPIAVRDGIKLFDEDRSRLPLKLLRSETFETGVLNLVYGPEGAAPEGSYKDAVGHMHKS